MSERVRCEGRPAWVKALRPSYSGGVGQRAVQRSTKVQRGPRTERENGHPCLTTVWAVDLGTESTSS